MEQLIGLCMLIGIAVYVFVVRPCLDRRKKRVEIKKLLKNDRRKYDKVTDGDMYLPILVLSGREMTPEAGIAIGCLIIAYFVLLVWIGKHGKHYDD